MKKLLKLFTGTALVSSMLLANFSQPVNAERGSWMPIEVNIEGKLLSMPVDPVSEDGTTLVPMRAIFEKLGATVSWDSKAQKVTAKKGTTTIELTIGSKTAKVNGKASQLLVAPKIVNGTTLIPLRFVSESLGMYVAWIESERQVYIAKDRVIEGTTMESVKALHSKYAPTFKGERFAVKPSYKAPYTAGKLNDGFLQDGLKAANFVREMAKLPLLTMSDELNELSMYGANILSYVQFPTHEPDRAPGMTEEFFTKSYTSTQKSNLYMELQSDKPVELVRSVKGFSVDQGVYNVGHRRWLLDPNLKTTGLGYGSFTNSKQEVGGVTTMFVVSGNKNTDVDYDYVSWPSKGYFPVSWMDTGMLFSLTPNPAKYDSPDMNKLTGSVTNLVDGKVLKLQPWKTENFDVQYESLGYGDTITFFPKSDDFFFDTPNPGDEFVIEFKGLTKLDGTPATIKYTVKLFAI